MAQATLIRLYGVTSHFRDPRFNTGKVGSLPIHTLICPPPCTVHGLLCAAKGGWVPTENLVLGWKIEYVGKCTDFQTCWLPQRKEYLKSQKLQKSLMSPRDREFLVFPRLTILGVSGVDASWFRCPVNTLCLGRSEDLIIRTTIEAVSWEDSDHGWIGGSANPTYGFRGGQCVPMGLAAGTLYSAPLFYAPQRVPVQFSPKTDVTRRQEIQGAAIAHISKTDETFYLWKFSDAG
jgi:hypothetical protein